jgi:putative membrane protein
MQEYLSLNYEWLRALHIIAIIAWMAGILYLPRLFVYHADATVGSELSETFKIMEGRLLRYICNPAMIASWILGLSMLWANPALIEGGWMHTKLTAVLLMSGVHGVLAKHTRIFKSDQRIKSANYYRILNEIPTVLLIIIVIMAVVQPF